MTQLLLDFTPTVRPKRWATGDQARALIALHARPATDFELAAITGRKQTSIGKRRGELVAQGLCVDSGQRRPSDTGSPAVVWALTDLGHQRAEFLLQQT